MPVPTSPEMNAQNSSKESVSSSSTPSELSGNAVNDPCVVAGYEDCLRETIRFLVQEEKLPEEHPLVSGLNFHLASDNAHKELLRVSDQLAKKLSEELRSTLTDEDEDDSGVETSSVSDEEEMAPVKAYRVTLEENDDNEEEMEEDDEDSVFYMEESSDDEGGDDIITAKDILSHPYLRNELIKLVFQGCDLVASPSAAI